MNEKEVFGVKRDVKTLKRDITWDDPKLWSEDYKTYYFHKLNSEYGSPLSFESWKELQKKFKEM